MLTIYNILILFIGIIFGWIIAGLIKKKKYRSIIKRLLEKLDERDEWIKMLKEQGTKAS